MQLIVPLTISSAGVAFLAAIQSCILAIHRPRSPLLGMFAIMSLLACGYQGANALYYTADSVTAAGNYLQWQFAFICIITLLFIMFFGYITNAPRLVATFIAAAIPFTPILVVNSLSPFSARFATLQMDAPMVFFWGEQLAHFNGQASPWRHLFSLLNLGILIWCTWRLRIMSRQKRTTEFYILLGFIILLCFSAIWGGLIDYGIFRSVYLPGFIFVLFCFTVSIRYSFLLKQQTIDLLRANHEIRTFSLLADQSPSSLLITDLEGFIQYANPNYCRTSGYTYQEVIGLHSSHLKSGQHPNALYEELWQTISSGKIWRGELTNKKKNGDLYLESITIFPITNDDNEIIRYVGIKEEITEQRKNEEKQQQAKRFALIGQLAGGVAHEVRNPLNSILANTEALFRERTIYGDKELAPYQHHIRTQVTRLSRLMNDLLDLGKAIPQTDLVPQNPLAVCHETICLLHATLDYSHKRIRLDIGSFSKEPRVMADGERLKQILLNLLENACQHSLSDNSVILLVFPADDKNLCFRIQDAGPGIAPNDLAGIFEPFYSKRHGGTGLGLTIAKHFTEAMGGTLTVTNNNPPPGCCAELLLPGC